MSRSLVQLIKAHPAVGWVRGDLVPDEGATAEILRLRQELEKLKGDLERSSTNPPPGTENLAQGDDMFDISCSYHQRNDLDILGSPQTVTIRLSWNDIFGTLAPMMIDEASEREMRSRLRNYVIEQNPWLATNPNRFDDVSETSFEKIKVQLRALGLINKSVRSHGIKDQAKYWGLTPYGDAVMMKIHAIRRP